MTAHAKLAPSASDRWFECPGSIRLCEGLPDEPSEAADNGTFSHEIAAPCLEKGNRADSIVGLQSPCGRFLHDQERADHIQTYLDAVNLTRMLHGGELRVETKVEAVPGVWGHSDAILGSKQRLDVFDLKYGEGVYVDPSKPQGLIYGCGALTEFGPAAAAIVAVHIVQPRHRADPKWRTYETTADALRTWRRDVLQPKVDATKDPNAPLVPGDHCVFCPAKATCPARNEQRSAVSRAAFGVSAPGPLLTPTPPERIPLEDLASLAQSFDLVEDWISTARKHLYNQAQSGVAVPGFKLVDKFGNRAWTDEAAAAKKLKKLGIDTHPKPKPVAPKMVSPNQAETQLKGKENKDARAAVKAAVADLTHQPKTGAVLVPSDNPRAPMDKGAALREIAQQDNTQ